VHRAHSFLIRIAILCHVHINSIEHPRSLLHFMMTACVIREGTRVLFSIFHQRVYFIYCITLSPLWVQTRNPPVPRVPG